MHFAIWLYWKNHVRFSESRWELRHLHAGKPTTAPIGS